MMTQENNEILKKYETKGMNGMAEYLLWQDIKILVE